MKSRYPFTPSAQANSLLERSGTALLIGLCLDQQVRTEKAFFGPYELQRRLGHVDAKKIAQMPAAKLAAVFRARPALHRYPRMMAKRVRALCTVIAHEYGNDGARVWAGVADAAQLRERLRSLPGFGAGKAAVGIYILANFAKKKLRGWRRYAGQEESPWEFNAGKKLG
jgi:uncharacterized HhH-GPD family protein